MQGFDNIINSLDIVHVASDSRVFSLIFSDFYH